MCHPDAPAGDVEKRVPTRTVEVPLRGGERMPASLALARDDAPTVIVIADVFGASAFYEHLCAVLAGSGFNVLLPEYFFRQGSLSERTHEAAFARRRKLDEAGSIADLCDAAAWAREQPGYSGAIGVVGFCMGGTFALDLAAEQSDLVTVAYYGFPRPQVGLVAPPPAPLDLATEMQGPILAFWGDQDEVVGIDNVEAFVAAVQRSQAEFEYRVLPGLGHGFLADAAIGSSRPPGGDDAALVSWEDSVGHLRRHLMQATKAGV